MPTKMQFSIESMNFFQIQGFSIILGNQYLERCMTKSRLEAFSDGVLAIAITIMVLELKVPQGHDLASLKPLAPMLLAYLLSFVFIGIYWNNHHHMLQAADKVSGPVL